MVVRDDGSTDTTLEEITRFTQDQRVRLRTCTERAGSAAQSFFALIAESPADGFDFVALSDQDDVWDRGKLARACAVLQKATSAGYSGATRALWPDGRSSILRQADAVTPNDFLLEGAGQGCTFVLRNDFYARVRRFVLTHRSIVRELHYHDWALYALARSWGESWTFDPRVSTTYRQHAGNDTGARSSPAGWRKRVGLIKSGWYRRQLTLIAAMCRCAAPDDRVIREWSALLLAQKNWRRRLRIASACLRGGRRKRLDTAVVILSALAGWI